MDGKWTLHAWPDDQPEPKGSGSYLFRRDYRSLASARDVPPPRCIGVCCQQARVKIIK